MKLNTFQAAAKKYRTDREWTQTQMAVVCRVSRPTIARLEAGKKISERLEWLIQKTINGNK